MSDESSAAKENSNPLGISGVTATASSLRGILRSERVHSPFTAASALEATQKGVKSGQELKHDLDHLSFERVRASAVAARLRPGSLLRFLYRNRATKVPVYKYRDLELVRSCIQIQGSWAGEVPVYKNTDLGLMTSLYTNTGTSG